MPTAGSAQSEKVLLVLPGGAAAKAGDRYERSWTLLKLIDILEGDATRVTLEPVGEAGVEFRLELPGSRVQWHQVKRQTADNQWTIGALRDVLIGFGPRLHSEEHCIFVSQMSAGRLKALCDRADSLDHDEFMNTLSKTMTPDFERLCRYWDAEGDVAHAMLRHLSVETVSGSFLDSQVEYRFRALVECDPAIARQALEDLISTSLHRELTPTDLRAALRIAGCQPRPWTDPAALWTKSTDLAEAFVRRVERNLPAGSVPHPAVERVLESLATGSRHVLVVGAAGAGKTAICSQLIASEIEQGRLAVPVSADRLPSVRTTKALGEELGLSNSPAAVLARLSPDDRSLLVIDQLDAVSQVSGRDLDRFEILSDLVAEADSHPNVALVIACRDFDLRHDPGLRVLVALDTSETVEIGDLDEDYVKAVLAEAGESELDPALLSFLRLPLHLSLFLEVRQDIADRSAVPTLQALYGHYWKLKREAVARVVGADLWVEVIDRVVGEMTRRETLALPIALLDEHAVQVAAMISEGVLDLTDNRVAFFHQSFFDYAFARRFAATGAPLAEFLDEADDQGLFIRSQVLQVLSYRRVEDPATYLSDLAHLTQSDRVRSHLRSVVFGFLGELPEPRSDEWAILRDVLSGPPSNLHVPFWAGIGRSPKWFPILDADGSWETWIASSDHAIAGRSLWALRGAVAAFPDRVVALLRPIAETGGDSAEEVLETLAAAEFEGGEPVVTFLLEVLEGNPDLGGLRLRVGLAKLAGRDPHLALDVIVQLLSWDVDAQEIGGAPFSRSGRILDAAEADRDPVQIVARQLPGPFVARVLPVVLGAMKRSPGVETEGLYPGRWSYNSSGEARDLSARLYRAILETFDLLGSDHGAELESSIVMLRENDSEGAANLMARCFIAAGPTYADDAAAWILSDTSLFDLADGTVSHWLSRELIGAIAPHIPQSRLEELTTSILGYYPSWETNARARRLRGMGQLTLLQGIPVERQTPQVKRRVAELARKLGREDVGAPRPAVMAGFVGSPVPPAAAEKMTDQQWLRAIAKYDSEDRQSEDFLKGGSRELARLLGAEAKKDPHRYANLLLQFPEDTDGAYYEEVLLAFAECELESDMIVDVCRKARRHGGSGARRWLVRLIEKNAHSDLPEELLQIVLDTVRSSPDPQRDTWKPQEGATQYYGGDIDFAGLNSTRGSAALAIASLIREDHERLDVLLPGVDAALDDDVEAVRACGFEALLSVLTVDPDLAIQRFLTVVDGMPDGVLGSGYFGRFVHWAARSHVAEVLPTLEGMIGNSDESVRRIASQQLAFVSLGEASLDATVDRCLRSGPNERKAAVEIFARNVAYEPRRGRVISVLSAAFDDPDKEVRDAAQQAFTEFGNASLEPFAEMLERFAESRTMHDPFVWAFGSLGEGVRDIPDTAIRLCEQWLAIRSDDARDISTHVAAEGHDVAKVVLSLYSQRPSTEIRRRCLDVIDRLIEAGVYGIDRELDTAR